MDAKSAVIFLLGKTRELEEHLKHSQIFWDNYKSVFAARILLEKFLGELTNGTEYDWPKVRGNVLANDNDFVAPTALMPLQLAKRLHKYMEAFVDKGTPNQVLAAFLGIQDFCESNEPRYVEKPLSTYDETSARRQETYLAGGMSHMSNTLRPSRKTLRDSAIGARLIRRKSLPRSRSPRTNVP